MKETNQMGALAERLLARVEPLHEAAGDASHDFAHVRRVLRNALSLAEGTSADTEILSAAILLHDIVHIPKNDPRRAQAAEIGAQAAGDILRGMGVSDDRIAWVCRVIGEHSFSAGKKASCLESEIMQDADRLDAIGAIGVMRLVTTGGRMGSRYLHPEDPFLDSAREPEDRKFMVDHFFTKLFKLEGMMNTANGKTEAGRRTDWMRSFVDELKRETTAANQG